MLCLWFAADNPYFLAATKKTVEKLFFYRQKQVAYS